MASCVRMRSHTCFCPIILKGKLSCYHFIMISHIMMKLNEPAILRYYGVYDKHKNAVAMVNVIIYSIIPWPVTWLKFTQSIEGKIEHFWITIECPLHTALKVLTAVRYWTILKKARDHAQWNHWAPEAPTPVSSMLKGRNSTRWQVIKKFIPWITCLPCGGVCHISSIPAAITELQAVPVCGNNAYW